MKSPRAPLSLAAGGDQPQSCALVSASDVGKFTLQNAGEHQDSVVPQARHDPTPLPQQQLRTQIGADHRVPPAAPDGKLAHASQQDTELASDTDTTGVGSRTTEPAEIATQ